MWCYILKKKGHYDYISLSPLSFWFGICIFLKERICGIEKLWSLILKRSFPLYNIPKTNYLLFSYGLKDLSKIEDFLLHASKSAINFSKENSVNFSTLKDQIPEMQD